MKKKWIALCTICIIVSLIIAVFPKRPKLISNITTLNTSYMTILVDKRELKNIKKLEEKLLQMCREDSFKYIKLHTEDRPLAERWVISVYSSRSSMEKGNPIITIKKDAED